MDTIIKQNFLIQLENTHAELHDIFFVKKYTQNLSAKIFIDEFQQVLVKVLLYEQSNHYYLKKYEPLVVVLIDSWETFKKSLYDSAAWERKGIPRDIDELKKTSTSVFVSLEELIDALNNDLFNYA